MTCKKCGKRLNGEPEVCPRCGAPLKATVSLGAIQAAHSKGKQKKKLTKKELALRIAIISVAALLALALVGYTIVWGFLEGSIQEGSELSGDMAINEALPPAKEVRNIALFGLDTRRDSEEGRSDAIIILSIDQVHNQIKMTSIARDSLVKVDGYPSYDGKTKITHAFSHGGVQCAVKTLNQNFGMNIQDYVYVNFFEFAEIIDYIGGVYIDVDAAELDNLNNYYAPDLRHHGIECEPLAGTGYQLLTGGQALAYSRNRYTGSDIDRGNRQKEVLESAFTAVKSMSLTKFPGLISKVLGICHTSLSSNEIMSLATWAVTGSPGFVNYTLPDKECNAWGGIDGSHGWVYIYDLEFATARLHNFIYEKGMDMDATRTTSRYTPVYTTTTTTTTAAPVLVTTTTTTEAPYSTSTTAPTEMLPTDTTGSTDPLNSTDPIADPTASTSSTAQPVDGTTGSGSAASSTESSDSTSATESTTTGGVPSDTSATDPASTTAPQDPVPSDPIEGTTTAPETV